MALTDIQCRNAKCEQGKARTRLADSEGLYLEVRPNGSKYWWLKYRFGGKEKRLSLGTYPEVPLASKARADAKAGPAIKGARQLRDEARALLREGIDPVQAKQDTKAARALSAEHTFESVALTWWEHWKGPKSERHSDYVKRRLEADVFPMIGKLPIADIDRKSVV